MKQKFYKIFRKSIAARLLLLVSLLVGGGDFVWAQKSLPYSYGFENNDLAAEGWTTIDKIDNTSIQKKGAYGVQVRTDDYSFRFYSGYNKTEYLVSPLLSPSANGIEFSFYYKNATTFSKETFYVGYSTTDGVGEPQASSFSWLPGALLPAASMSDFQKYSVTINNTSIKYIAIKHVSANSHNVFIDDVTIEPAETYKRPKALNVSFYTSTTAKLSWTKGNDETKWEIAYSTKEDFNPLYEGIKVPVTDDNECTLTGLINGVSYYAYVRANYDGNYSEWSNKVEFCPSTILSLNDDKSEEYTNAPIHNNTNYGTVSQFVIPASKLVSINNSLITKVTFYTKETEISWTGATFDVFLDEPETTTYASYSVSLKDWGTQVVSAKVLSVSEGKLQIELDVPFKYTSGNLLIGIKENGNTSSSVTSTWLGVKEATNYTSAYTYKNSSSGTQWTGSAQFSPKTTIETTTSTTPVTLGTNGYTTFACPRTLDLANLPSGLKAYKASVTGTTVRFSEVNQAVPANTGVLLKGEADQTYDIPFADSGSALGDNAFEVNSTGGTFDAESGYTYFGLIKNSNPLTFGEFAPSTVAIPTNKAYLKVLTSSLPAESRQLTFLFDENETTAINDLPTAGAKMVADAIFNLTGQKVNAPTKGLYIINGKKYIIK